MAVDPMEPNDTEGAPLSNVEYLNDRRPDSHVVEGGLRAHRAALEHLHKMYDLLDAENEGEEVDWSDAAAPFCGCTDCVVREVLWTGVRSLQDSDTIRINI
jgi:hypothetical protein